MDYNSRLVKDQLLGGITNEVNIQRINLFNTTMSQINSDRLFELSIQDNNFINAVNEVQKVKDLLGYPSKILGSNLTKHGEIAEHVEVHIGNAKEFIKGMPQRFSFEGVGRTAPEDFIMDGIKAQSKFINSENNTLSAVLEHLEKYKNIDFGRDGSKYVIPKDYYERILAIKNGESVKDFSDKTINSILNKIKQIEQETGKDFEDVVKSSISTYREVQQGKITETLSNHEDSIKTENESIKSEIKENAEKKEKIAIEKSTPSMQEALKVAAISGLIEGSVQTVIAMFKKKKNIADYNADDWKDVGIVFGKSTGLGAVRGLAIYGLTNYAAMPAPLAASFVSASYGIAKLYHSYKRGDISLDEMMDQGEILCFDTTLNLIGSSIGQALIPIPVLGAVIGSISANILGGVIKNELDKNEQELIRISKYRYKCYMEKLEGRLAKDIEKIVNDLLFMWGLSRQAFNFKINYNLRLAASVKLAKAHGVQEDKILSNIKQIDNYFMN